MLKEFIDFVDSWNLAELNSRDKMRTRLLLAEKREAILKEMVKEMMDALDSLGLDKMGAEKKEAVLKEVMDVFDSWNLNLNLRDKVQIKMALAEKIRGKPAAKKDPWKITTSDVVYFALFLVLVVLFLWKC